jgi:hypothetical protein
MNNHFIYSKKISLTPNQRIDDTLKIEADSDFIIEKVYASYDDSFKINIIDTSSNYNWFSDRIRAENWFGTPQYPNELTKSIEILRNTLLKIDIENLVNAPNNIEIAFEGYRIYDTPITIGKTRYFAYVKDLTINALDLISDNILTNADSDFIIQRLVAYKDEDYSLELKLSASNLGGRRLNNEFCNIDNMFGSVLRPNILKHPLTIEKNSLIQFDVRNLLNSIIKAQIVFDGVKVWR